NAPAVRSRRKETHVIGQGPKVAGMVGEALEFESDAAQDLGPDGNLAAGERFHRLAVSRCVPDRCVSGDGLHHVDGALVWSADACSLSAAVLISERNLQVEHLFAVALKPEVPRLDDPRMDGADGHLVDLFSLHTVEVRNADHRRLVRLPTPRIVAWPIRSMEPDRLEPGVAFRADAVLLGDLPL